MKKKPKISIVTLVKNGMPFIEDSINSFNLQKYSNKELIVVYSNSEDNTYKLLKTNKYIDKVIIDNNSKSLYGSLNKGIEKTSGDLIGILHSDDIFYDEYVLSRIAKKFLEKNFDIGYGDIIISKSLRPQKIIRIWKSEKFKISKLTFGWMPPHVSIFINKKLKNEKYLENLKISSDYQYIIKIFKKYKKIEFFNFYTTIMRSGGLSNSNILLKLKEDIIVAKKIFKFSKLTIFFKISRKLNQFVILNRKIKLSNYLRNFFYSKYKVVNDANLLIKKKKFILSAFNMAFASYVHDKVKFNYKYLWVWPDGILSKYILKKNKIPGRLILSNLRNEKSIKNIYLISSKNKKNINYLKDKFRNKKFTFINAPFGSEEYIVESISRKIKKIPEKSLILLGLPTPKQEYVASYISTNINEFRVICLGGAINYNSKDTKIPPKFFENYFESIWRLQNDTFRRSIRLISSLAIVIKRICFRELTEI